MRLLMAAVTLSVCGFAQEFRATISGRVTDSAGAAVANARVAIRNPDTGELSSTLTSEEGAYQVSFLIPGNYVVTVEKPGFKKTVREGVRLEIAQHGVLDLVLALGEVTQSVTVSEKLAGSGDGVRRPRRHVRIPPRSGRATDGPEPVLPSVVVTRRHPERIHPAPPSVRYLRFLQHGDRRWKAQRE